MKLILFDAAGSSRPISTAIVTMRNKDRFSGTMLNPRIIVRTDYMTQTCQPDKINRIIFSADNDREVTVQLTNGDIIQAEYFPGLDAVIAVLEKNPDLKLEIQGAHRRCRFPGF